MYRRCLQFYINKNDELSCVWYAQRKYKLTGQYRDIKQDIGIDDDMYAVRRVTLRYNCDKNGICRVSHEFDSIAAQKRIIQFMGRVTRVTPHTLKDGHLRTLRFRAPKKYVELFFAWYELEQGQTEFESMCDRFYSLEE